MIDKTYVWMISSNEKNKVNLSTSGKWVMHGRYFKRLFKKIDELVELGIIYGAKYTHKEFPERDPLPFEKPVLCVYADDSTKEKTYNELLKLGLEPEFWKYDAETANDWSKDGKLKQKSQNQREYLFYSRLLNL